MNFYSTLIDINDRRLYTLELQEQHQANSSNEPSKSFVIDVSATKTFKILGISNEEKIKSFVIDGTDKNLSLCNVSATNEHGIIHIIINADLTQAAPPAPPPTPTESPREVSDSEDISFDDIEDFRDYGELNKKPKAPEPPTFIPEVKRQVTDLGRFNSYISLSLEVNEYGLRLDGILTARMPVAADPIDTMKVVITFINDGKQYQESLLIALSHPSEYLGIALDFGSESSQMAVNSYQAAHPFAAQKPELEHLYRNILKFHKFKEWIDRNTHDEYYQEEEGTSFYKSLFFIKKKLDGNYNNFRQKTFLEKQAINLKMMVEKKQGYSEMSKDFIQLPNLKILHDHGNILESFRFDTETNEYNYSPDLKLAEIKDKVYNSILETMISSLLTPEYFKDTTIRRNIRMMLLVPNNYDTKNITTVQQYLSQIFENIKNNDSLLKDWVKTIEVLTISESDASFIGYMNKSGVQVQQCRDYIIIDSGKGTTDFSIIRTGQQNIHNLSSVYRNGFTGAGNLITYAIFETVIHYLRSVSPDDGTDISFIQQQVIQSLKDNDLKSRNDFFNALERLKFNYRDISERDTLLRNWAQVSADTTEGATRLANIGTSGGNIQSLTELLNKVSGITDFYGYIQEACEFITNSVSTYLSLVQHHKKDLQISGAILTGRAFRFKPLADMMLSKLSTELNVKHIDVLQGNELKDICIRGVFNRDIKINAENTGYPIQVIYKHKEDIPLPDEVAAKDKKTKTNIFQRAFGFFVEDLASLERVSEIRTIKDTVQTESLANSEFIIGCKRYNIKSDQLSSFARYPSSEISIDFSQEGYQVRSLNNGRLQAIFTLSEKDRDVNSSTALVTPSLFPNYLDEQFIQSLHVKVNKQGQGIHTNNPIDDDDLFTPSPSRPPQDDSLFF